MSIFGPNEDVRTLFTSVQAVIGPGPIVDENIGGDPCYHLHGQYNGHRIHAFVSTDGGLLFSVRFGVPLGDRPITLRVNHRKNTRIHGVPEVRTGDAQFDGLFLLNGFPPSVVEAALDGPTRAWLVEQFAAREPPLTAEAGEVTLNVVLVKSLSNAARHMPPAEVGSWLEQLLPIADRLASAFDGQRDQIGRSQGPRAAEDWVRGYTAATQARADQRSQVRLGLYAAVIAPVMLALFVGALALGLVLAYRKPKVPPVAQLDLLRTGAEASFQARAGQRVTFRTSMQLDPQLMIERNWNETRNLLMASRIEVVLIAPDGSKKAVPCPLDGRGVETSETWNQDNDCSFDVAQSGTHGIQATVRWFKVAPRAAVLGVVVQEAGG
ncbi:MAG: hypothetical protein IPI67_38540 [Myxococcales bacterium]|nr:hypothetical protein [Myxococcales bacterium]